MPTPKTFAITVVTRRILAESRELYIEWSPADEELAMICMHGASFDLDVSDAVLDAYAETVARPSMLAAVDAVFPGVYASVLG